MRTQRGKMGKRPGRPRMDGDIEEEVQRLARLNRTAAQILRELGKRPEFKGRLPQERTMRRAVRWYRPDDTSGWWSVAEADPEDAALVLPVLAGGIERGGGWWQRFSKDLAGWIVKVRVAAPDIPPLWAFRVAQEYSWRESREEPTDSLDTMLAFAPWHDESQLHRYLRAVERAHRDWFAIFDLTWAGGDTTVKIRALRGEPVERVRPLPGALISLAYGVAWRPEAAGLMTALECWELQREKGTSDD